MKKNILKPFTLLFTLVCYIYINWYPPIELNEAYGKYVNHSELDDFQEALVQQQLDKINMEIQGRADGVHSWYYNKFIVIGGLIFAIMGLSFFHSDRIDMFDLFNSSRFIILMGIASAFCFIIDTYIRSCIMGVNQMGVYIQVIVEKKFLEGDILGWESFLRDKGGMHADPWYGFFYWPILHLLTLLIYFLFVCGFVFYRFKDHTKVMKTIYFVFYMVQVVYALFAFFSRALPSAFRLMLFPTQKEICASPICAGTICLLLILLNTIFILNVFKSEGGQVRLRNSQEKFY